MTDSFHQAASADKSASGRKTKLRPTGHPHVFEAVDGGLEPLFLRSIERGEVQFSHQSGYGYLPESQVEVRND